MCRCSVCDMRKGVGKEWDGNNVRDVCVRFIHRCESWLLRKSIYCKLCSNVELVVYLPWKRFTEDQRSAKSARTTLRTKSYT